MLQPKLYSTACLTWSSPRSIKILFPVYTRIGEQSSSMLDQSRTGSYCFDGEYKFVSYMILRLDGQRE